MADLACDASLKNRTYDSDGMLRIERTPISKAAVNPYYGREIPDGDKLGLNPDKIYYLLRDPGELAKGAPSFKTKQLMFEHVAVSAEDPKQESVAGTIGSNVDFEAPYLVADIKVWDAEAIAGIETDSVRELSASYRYRADMTPGVYEGQRYDGVMRDIEGNHVALVKSGRAGSDVMAADSKMETKMETKFGNVIYSILRAISPKLAKDASLKPLVIGLTPKQFNPSELVPKLLAMDAAIPKEETEKAMEAAKNVAGDEDDKSEKYADLAEKGGDKKAKDEEEKKKAEDAEKMCRDSFDDLVKKLEAKGYSKEYATKVAGKVAAEKGDDKAKDKDVEDKDGAEGLEKKKAEDTKKAMDEFRAELRQAEDARRAVRPVVGDVFAFDSAEEIYAFALDQMKVDRKDVTGVPALRALFNLAQESVRPAAKVAYDSNSLAEKFPNASRNIQMM